MSNCRIEENGLGDAKKGYIIGLQIEFTRLIQNELKLFIYNVGNSVVFGLINSHHS